VLLLVFGGGFRRAYRFAGSRSGASPLQPLILGGPFIFRGGGQNFEDSILVGAADHFDPDANSLGLVCFL